MNTILEISRSNKYAGAISNMLLVEHTSHHIKLKATLYSLFKKDYVDLFLYARNLRGLLGTHLKIIFGN